MKLLNGRELAKAIGKCEWWVCQARKAGMPFYCGGITFKEALDWMRANPNFVAADQLAKPCQSGVGRPRKSVGKNSAHQRTERDHPRKAVDRYDGSKLKHGRHIAEPLAQERQTSQAV